MTALTLHGVPISVNTGATTPTPTPTPTTLPGFTGPVLSGIAFNQAQPVADSFNANTWGQGGNNKTVVATFTPVGGVGPFQYLVLKSDGTFDATYSGYTGLDTTYSIFVTPAALGWIGQKQNAGASNSLVLKIIDATGATCTEPVTIDETLTGTQIWLAAQHRVIARNTSLANLMSMEGALWNNGTLDLTTPITITDTGNYFVAGGPLGQGITAKSYSATDIPADGTYTVTINASGYPTKTITYTVSDGTIGTAYFLQTIAVISTSMLPGAPLGIIVATTPNNSFILSVTDATGVVGNNGNTVILAAQPTVVGTHTFTATLNDNGLVVTDSFSFTVVQGVTVPSSQMTLAVPQNITNDQWSIPLGTPLVSGITGTPSWTITAQDGENPVASQAPNATPYAAQAGYSLPNRISINPSTGAMAAAYLSPNLDGVSPANTNVTVSCTDGINTCTNTFPIPCAWAPVSQTYYVGRGQAAAQGASGYEHMAQLRAVIAGQWFQPHVGTYVVNIVADADDDYFANDTSTGGPPYTGPIRFVGIAANGKAMPRLGGLLSNNLQNQGVDGGGKGALTCGPGDFVLQNIAITGCHGGTPGGRGGGNEATRKDGSNYGNWSAFGLLIRDSDFGILGGNYVQGGMLIDGCDIGNCGTSHESSGAGHCIYIGTCSYFELRNSVVRLATCGHNVKSRAMVTKIHGNRIYGGNGGNASTNTNIPWGGDAEVWNNVYSKDVMAQTPSGFRYADEGLAWTTNVFNIHDNQIDILTPVGNHWGTPCIVDHRPQLNSNGVLSHVILNNNSVYLAPGAEHSHYLNYNGDLIPDSSFPGATVETNTTLRTTTLVFSTSSPLGGTLPILGPLYRTDQWTSDNYTNFENAGQSADREWFTAAVGFNGTLGTIRASNDLVNQGAFGTPNPWSAGTEWGVITTGIYYNPTPSPFAATNLFGITTNADGSGSPTVIGDPAAGVYLVQYEATAPNGAKSDWRYVITIV